MRFNRVMELVEARLREVPYFAGSEFTAADIMSVFSLTTMRLFQPVSLGPYPGILRYLQRIGERPAYRRAMAKSDPDSSRCSIEEVQKLLLAVWRWIRVDGSGRATPKQ